MLEGLVQHDFPLTLQHVLGRMQATLDSMAAERLLPVVG